MVLSEQPAREAKEHQSHADAFEREEQYPGGSDAQSVTVTATAAAAGSGGHGGGGEINFTLLGLLGMLACARFRWLALHGPR